MPAREPDPDPAPDVLRSEEELVVTKRIVPVGAVRVSKRVVTETVTLTAQVRREELVVEEVPAGDEDEPVEALSAAEMTIVLSEERADIVTRVVPIERVRVIRRVVTDEVDVDEALRKEQVSVEDPRER